MVTSSVWRAMALAWLGKLGPRRLADRVIRRSATVLIGTDARVDRVRIC
jgi:hypothetical protein